MAYFEDKSAWLMQRLIDDFTGLQPFQAAGFAGNFGAESGLRAVQEGRPISGRGGFGWAQWTGPRRVQFEAWCKRKGLSQTSDEANYSFLYRELVTTFSFLIPLVKQTKSVDEATQLIERRYEMAGIVNMAGRLRFAHTALAAYQARIAKGPINVPKPTPAPVPAKPATTAGKVATGVIVGGTVAASQTPYHLMPWIIGGTLITAAVLGVIIYIYLKRKQS